MNEIFRDEDRGLRMISLGVISQALYDYFYGTGGMKEDAVAFFFNTGSAYGMYLDVLGVGWRPLPTDLLRGMGKIGAKITRDGLRHRRTKEIFLNPYDLLQSLPKCDDCGREMSGKNGANRARTCRFCR